MRRRIADDLHDDLIQVLALASLKLGALRASLSTGPVAAVDEIRTLIDQSVLDARSLIFELSPPILYEIGFEAALEWLGEHFFERHNLVCDIEDDGQPKPLGEEKKIVLFQAVRELLQNVVKHGKAQRTRVTLSRVDDLVRVRVEDYGVGFDPSAVAATQVGLHGFGLFSIGERLGFLGGHLEVESEIGGGTRVTLTAPVSAKRE